MRAFECFIKLFVLMPHTWSQLKDAGKVFSRSEAGLLDVINIYLGLFARKHLSSWFPTEIDSNQPA